MSQFDQRDSFYRVSKLYDDDLDADRRDLRLSRGGVPVERNSISPGRLPLDPYQAALSTGGDEL